jgi:hypothetical protein
MTSKAFDNELNSLFEKNQSKRLYNDQFKLLIERLKTEYKILNEEKMHLYRTVKNPDTSPELRTVEKRIQENRAEIMELYKTTVT